jgi:uncharacterized protein (TIGR02001 family)
MGAAQSMPARLCFVSRGAVIVLADPSAPRAHARRAKCFVWILAACAYLFSATPATAEVGAAISVFSDARFRGYSLSSGQPVAILDLSYDDASGAYAAVSGSAVVRTSEVEPLGLQLNAGYARRLSSIGTLDVGIVHSEYSNYSTAIPGNSDTELYVGLTRKHLSGRLYFSPHYFESGTWTLYGELDHSLDLAPTLNLNGHIGMLAPVRRLDGSVARSAYDWRVRLNRQFGRLSVHAAATGGRQVYRYEGIARHDGKALVFGATLIF